MTLNFGPVSCFFHTPFPSPPSVPHPTVTITGSPIDSGFHAGVLLTFTGRAEFDRAVNSHLNVAVMWTKTAPPSDLSADGRVTAGEVVMVGGDPMVFESNLTINTISDRLDNGTYTLSLNISSTQPNTLGTTVSEGRTIMVTSKSCDPHRVCAECVLPCRIPVTISPMTGGIPTAGGSYTLECSITRRRSSGQTPAATPSPQALLTSPSVEATAPWPPLSTAPSPSVQSGPLTLACTSVWPV